MPRSRWPRPPHRAALVLRLAEPTAEIARCRRSCHIAVWTRSATLILLDETAPRLSNERQQGCYFRYLWKFFLDPAERLTCIQARSRQKPECLLQRFDSFVRISRTFKSDAVRSINFGLMVSGRYRIWKYVLLDHASAP